MFWFDIYCAEFLNSSKNGNLFTNLNVMLNKHATIKIKRHIFFHNLATIVFPPFFTLFYYYTIFYFFVNIINFFGYTIFNKSRILEVNMKTKYFYMVFILFIFLFFLTGCNDDSKNSNTSNTTNNSVQANRLSSNVTVQNNSINSRKQYY